MAQGSKRGVGAGLGGQGSVPDLAYPQSLRDREESLIERRRNGASAGREPRAQAPGGGAPEAPGESRRPTLGVALSGGGIRSATFCLGVFQSLARRRLLGDVDLLSTVSGGGYFGGFLGRLFSRGYVQSVADVERALAPRPALMAGEGGASATLPGSPAEGEIFRWLRENGRYLSPRGGGDTLLGGAVLLRNWISVQVVLATLILALFLLAQMLRWGFDQAIDPDIANRLSLLLQSLPGGRDYLWWSPYVLLSLPILAFLAVPAGAGYWILRLRQEGRSLANRLWILLALVCVAGLALWGSLKLEGATIRGLSIAILLAALLTPWFARLAQAKAVVALRRQGEGWAVGPSGAEARLFRDEWARHWISVQLKFGLVLIAAVLAFALVDSFGQTLYVVASAPESDLGKWLAGVFAGFLAVAAGARRLVVLFSGRVPGRRLRIPLSILTTVAAVLITGVVLSTIAAFSHAVAWGFAEPKTGPPSGITAQRAQLLGGEQLVVEPEENGWWIESRVIASGTPAAVQTERPAGAWLWLLGSFLVTAALSWIFSRSWRFLNRSTNQPLYTARLTRAYLGASNPDRVGSDAAEQSAVVQVLPGDDVDCAAYWSEARGRSPYEKGAPLHLINVTINETVDGRSQVQQQDRKGVGMALGPAGLSVGVRHHAVFSWSEEVPLEVLPRTQGFHVFAYPDTRGFPAESLSIGQWIGISGAAFSTGVGSRTHLGLSLLTGLGNVRLGYWWDSCVLRRPKNASNWARLLSALWRRSFPVQHYLLREFLARFHGTAERHWYLSDGGHFENLGAYELIRRRIPHILVIDAGADPGYGLEDLANLVRKARLDFGAEIAFLDEAQIDERVPAPARRYFGTLEELRRGVWVEDPLRGKAGGAQEPVPGRDRYHLEREDSKGLSLAHAALARVRYGDDGSGADGEGWLVYVKPTLVGDEPADVLNYHAQHASFPHESTADQFFDEAQWEAYRRLGEVIADKVLPGGGALLGFPDSESGEGLAPRRRRARIAGSAPQGEAGSGRKRARRQDPAAG